VGTVVLPTVTPQPRFGGCGQSQPIALTTAIGDGRGFTLVLCHEAETMLNKGFKTLLLHGALWATHVSTSYPSHPIISIT
jgi:type 1 glutamine amidotransferase